LGQIPAGLPQTAAVASLGLVSPGAVTDGVTLLPKKIDDLFSVISPQK